VVHRGHPGMPVQGLRVGEPLGVAPPPGAGHQGGVDAVAPIARTAAAAPQRQGTTVRGQRSVSVTDVAHRAGQVAGSGPVSVARPVYGAQ
jgi:hypothetical protein